MSEAKRLIEKGVQATSTCCPDHLSRQLPTSTSTSPCSFKYSSAEHIHALLCMSLCVCVCVCCVCVCENICEVQACWKIVNMFG